MSHLTHGTIRAYLDGEVLPQAAQQIEAHLQSCPRCQSAADDQRLSARQVEIRLSDLHDLSEHRPAPVHTARARLEARRLSSNKEQQMQNKNIFQKVPRLTWISLAIVAVLAIAMTFAPLRAIATSFLGLFRVQQIQVVQVNPADFPQQLGESSQFESMLTSDLAFQEQGDPQPVASLAEAAAQLGFTARLPEAAEGAPQLTIQPGGSAVFTVNMEHVRQLLAEIGRSDIQLPEAVNGATVTLTVPASLSAQYGECEFDVERMREQGYDPDDGSIPPLPKCTTLIQMPSPEISAPPGLDIQKIGEAYLQVLGMSQAEAEAFAGTIDWTTTLVIPIPRYNATYREVSVDGVPATLIMSEMQSRAGQYMLVWVKDGIVYALTGPGDAYTALTVADSLK
jgi:hypothetical protein